MPIEYSCLLVMTLFFMVAWLPTSMGKLRSFGAEWAASNRDTIPKEELPIWATRFERAYLNLKDYFPAFVVAILVLGALKKFDHSTSIAAIAFVVGRILHYVSYGLGSFPFRFIGYNVAMAANFFLLIKCWF